MKFAPRNVLLATAALASVIIVPLASATKSEAQLCGTLCRLGVGAAAVGAGVAVGSNLANRAMNRNQGTTVVVQQQPRCHIQNQQVVNQFGQVIAVRQVQVCQ